MVRKSVMQNSSLMLNLVFLHNQRKVNVMAILRQVFDNKHGADSPEQLQRELLYQLYRSNELTERTRRNTAILVNWLVALPFLFAAFWVMVVILGLAM